MYTYLLSNNACVFPVNISLGILPLLLLLLFLFINKINAPPLEQQRRVDARNYLLRFVEIIKIVFFLL